MQSDQGLCHLLPELFKNDSYCFYIESFQASLAESCLVINFEDGFLQNKTSDTHPQENWVSHEVSVQHL